MGMTPLDNAVLAMIRAHVGKPCPTRRDVMEWACIPRRHVWRVLAEMERRGLIEVEVRGVTERTRRMRKAGGRWTLWSRNHPENLRTCEGRWTAAISGRVAA